MLRLTRVILAPALLAAVACSSEPDVPADDAGAGGLPDAPLARPDAVTGPNDTGIQAPHDAGTPPDAGELDAGAPADTGAPDAGAAPDAVVGPDALTPDVPIPDLGPAPPATVMISGVAKQLGQYLAGNDVPVANASMLAYGVAPQQSTTTDGTGAYALTLPANGRTIVYTNKAGYFPSYNTVTTQAANVTNKNVYVAELAWLNAIATAHNVNLAQPFACHGPQNGGGLDPQQQCTYAAVVGRILDDGAAGNGTPRPVAGIAAADFRVTAGPMGATWYKKGPYFLDATGTASVGATQSIVVNNNGTYRGGLFVTFVEILQIQGPPSLDVRISITKTDGTETRYFGPVDITVFRPNAVSWTTIAETGAPPPLNLTNINFDTQVYPLLLPVTQGGLGCQGCHTNQGGAQPAAGMNLYGGPAAAYSSLDPARYPQRVNTANPAASLLLVRPLYEPNGPQDHPIFAFASEQDPSYQLIYKWIQEGGVRMVQQAPVSFSAEVLPLLQNPTNNGGAGCYACHAVGNPNQAPANFWLGGNAAQVYAELTAEPPGDNGGTGEPYRINKTTGYADRSLLLLNPLTGSPEPHPVKLFYSNQDPRYQLIYRWISEGYRNN